MTIEELVAEQHTAGEAYLARHVRSKFGNGKKDTLLRAIENSVKINHGRISEWEGWDLKTDSGVEVDISLPYAEITGVFMDAFDLAGSWPYIQRSIPHGELRGKIPNTIRADYRYDLYLDENSLNRLYATKIATQPIEARIIHLIERTTYGTINSLTVKVRQGQSVARATQAALKKWWKDDPEIAAAFAKAHERLGQLWASRRGSWQVTFSVAPDNFLGLGHWGENSCFQAGGQHEASKLALMQTPKAVVVKFTNKNSGDAEAPDARAWGFWFEGLGLLVSNLYKLEWGQAAPILQAAVAELLDTKAPITYVDRGIDLANRMVDKALVYTNGDQKIFAPDPEALKKAIKEFSARVKAMKCGSCSFVQWNEELEAACQNCGHHLCPDCVRHAHMADGTEQTLCQRCLDRLPTLKCFGCEEHFHTAEGEASCQQCQVWYCPTCRADREPLELVGGRCQECRREEEEREERMAAVAEAAKVIYDLYSPGCTCERCQSAYRQVAG